MDKEKIKSSVKTSFSKYGLKESSIDKLVNIVETRISAMGTIENEDEVIKSEVALAEPYIAIIQPEIDSYRSKATEAKTELTPTTQETTSPNDAILAELRKIAERQDKIEQANLAAQKQAWKNQLIESVRERATTFKKTDEKSGWAVNAGLLNNAMKLVTIEDDDTAETIEQKCQQRYNEMCVDIFGSSDAVPGVNGGSGVNEKEVKEKGEEKIAQILGVEIKN